MAQREWTPEEAAGEAQRAIDTDLYVEAYAKGEADGRRQTFLEAADIASEHAMFLDKCQSPDAEVRAFTARVLMRIYSSRAKAEEAGNG